MTATRDRRSDPAEDAETAWDDRPIIGTSRGLPWWAAVLLAFGLAAVAAVVDMLMQGSLSTIYQGAYLVGCIGAVAAVRRRSLFGPMVQPPLVFAVTAIAAIILLDDETGGDGGLMELVFSVAVPLTSNFPTMAIATAVTVAVGLYRLWKERDPNPPVRAIRTKDRKPPKDDRNPRGDASEGRRDRPSKDRVAPPSRKPRDRPDPAPEKQKRGRQPRDRADRQDRSANRRDRPAGDRSTRDRDRDQDQQPRRRDPENRRPRRDERPPPARRDRDQGDRGTPRPRRRPPDQRR